MNTQLFEHIFFLLILLSLSFFFSGSETAFFSLPSVAVERLRQTSTNGKRIARLLGEPTRLLITVLIGNLIANILISEIIGLWALEIFRPLPYSVYLGSFTAIVVTTTILLLFGEIAPKTLAINNPDRFALRAAIPLHLFAKAVYPLLRIFLLFTDAILPLFGVRQTDTDAIITEDELKAAVTLGEEEGVLASTERLMIHRIIEFGETQVRDVFVPRTEVIRVKSNITVEELTKIMKETGHSRFPVYGETVDDIRGIVYAKDLFPYFWRGQMKVPITRFIRPAYYVPETKKVSDLLREFQTGRIHMAVVVGEYGGTKGLVTLEDLLEEVVGEIFDEYDVRTTEVEKLPDGALRVDARVRLDYLSKILGADIRVGDCETVGGLLFELLQRVPSRNEHVVHRGYEFLVEDIHHRRIRTIRVSSALESSKQEGEKVEG